MTGADPLTLIVFGAAALLALVVLVIALRAGRGQAEINAQLGRLAEQQNSIRDLVPRPLAGPGTSNLRTSGGRHAAGRRQPREQHGKDRRIASADPRAAGRDGPGAEEDHRPVGADGRPGEYPCQQAGARGVRRDPAARPGRDADAARRLHVPGDARQRQAGRLPAPSAEPARPRSQSTPSFRWRAGSACRMRPTNGSGSRPAAGSAPTCSSMSAT